MGGSSDGKEPKGVLWRAATGEQTGGRFTDSHFERHRAEFHDRATFTAWRPGNEVANLFGQSEKGIGVEQQEATVGHLQRALARTEYECERLPQATLRQQGVKGKVESDIGQL